MAFTDILVNIVQSFNPNHYDKLVDRKKRNALAYFVVMALSVFILTSILMTPNLLSLPDYLSSELSKFEELKVSLEYEQKDPVYLTKNMPIMIIDTLNNHTQIKEGHVLIANNAIFYRIFPFGEGNMIETGSENRLQGLNFIITALFIAALPVMLMAVFVYTLIKYFIVIILTVIAGFILARVARYGLSFKEVFNIGMFAGTPLIVVGLLSKPFIPSIGYLEYIIFFVYFFLGAVKVGDFEEVTRLSNERKKREY